MAQDGRKILKLTGAFLAIIGVVTLIIGIIAFSNAGKANDTISKAQALQSYESSSSSSATSSYVKILRDYAGKSKTYSMIMMGVSAMHIIFGIIGFLMAEKSENAMLCVGFGALMLLGAAGVIIYPLVVRDAGYDILQMIMELVKDDSSFKLLSLAPQKHLITYSGVLLGGMYLYGAMMSRGITPGSKPSTGRNVIPGTGPVDPDAFFEQFNKPPVPPKAPAPQGQPRPQGAPPQGQPRPQGAPPAGQPRPQGTAPVGQPRPQVRPAPNLRPAPGVKPPKPADDEGPTSSGSMDEVILPSAEDLERILGGMSGQK